jgi:hypothetical protein
MPLFVNNKNYKYSARFASQAKIEAPIQEKKNEALASLKNLDSVFSSDYAKKIEENPDLLFISSPLIGLNEVNLNGDCLLAKDILEIDNLFIGKFYDIEHDRSNGAVGAITSIGYITSDTNEVLAKERVLEYPYNSQFVAGGYLWRLIDKDLCELIENSSSNEDGFISTSFEFLFDDYQIVLSKDKNILDGIFIKPGEQNWAKYDKMLRCNGGAGFDKDSGLLVSRVLKDAILPVGIGIVRKPASGIQGILAVHSINSIPTENQNSDCVVQQENANYTKIDAFITEKIKNTIKQEFLSVNKHIKTNNKTIMDHTQLKSIAELETKWEEISKQEAVASIGTVRQVFEAEIAAKSEEYAKELRAKEEALKLAEANKTESEAKISNLSQAVAELQKELESVRQAQASAEADRAFQERMAALDSTFELDDEDRAFLKEEIEVLASDEAFAKWFEKKKKLMKEKTKTFIEQKKAEKSKSFDDNDSDDKDKMVKAAVASIVEEKGQGIANSSDSEGVSIKDLVEKVFKNSVTVGGKSIQDIKK